MPDLQIVHVSILRVHIVALFVFLSIDTQPLAITRFPQSATRINADMYRDLESRRLNSPARGEN